MIGLDRAAVAGVALALAGCASGGTNTVQVASAPGSAAAAAANGDVQAPLYGNLGPHARAIVTSSDEAQAYFNEGLLFMYAFGTSIAEGSFRAAQAADPQCAACYWGEAWSLAPYLNGGMSPGDERRAHAANLKAQENVAHASDVEKALIEAFVVRFDGEADGSRRKQLDTLYAEHMGKVAERFPDDLDVQTLYAEALMLLRPRRGFVDLDASDVQRILPILEGVLSRNIRHPGACHLYIHLVEASVEPGRAEACSDYLGNSIAVSHIHHMPSHIYMNIGRWGDAVRSNQQAWHADQKADHGGPPGVYPAHNLHMLLNAAVMDGQSAVAMQAAKDLSRLSGPWAWYIPVTHAAFGRWTEILEMPVPDTEEPLDVIAWSFSRGLAYLRSGRRDAASEELETIDEVLAELDPESRFRFHELPPLMELPRAILAAEIAHAAGRTEEAVAILEAGIEVEDGLLYSEPEPWQLPLRHYLGAILLEAGQAEKAEEVYRAAMEDHPNTGWVYFGLAQALEAQGKTSAAQEARRAFDRLWARADIWLRSSRF